MTCPLIRFVIYWKLSYRICWTWFAGKQELLIFERDEAFHRQWQSSTLKLRVLQLSSIWTSSLFFLQTSKQTRSIGIEQQDLTGRSEMSNRNVNNDQNLFVYASNFLVASLRPRLFQSRNWPLSVNGTEWGCFVVLDGNLSHRSDLAVQETKHKNLGNNLPSRSQNAMHRGDNSND